MFLLLPTGIRAQELYSIGMDGDQNEYGIFLGHYQDGAWEKETFLPAERFEENFNPALALGPAEEIWVVWAARRDGETPKIYFSRKQSGGWSEPRRVTKDDQTWEMTPTIALAGDGRPLVAWSGDRHDNSEIYSARWTGNDFGPGVRISTPGNSPNLNPALATAADGRAILTWQGWVEDYFQIFASFSHSRGWSREELLGQRSRTDRALPSVSALPGDRWECFWLEQGKIISTVGRRNGWSKPAPPRETHQAAPDPAGELSESGWVVGKDEQGTVRSRRTLLLFDTKVESQAIPTRLGGESSGNRVFIGYGDSITYGTDGPPMGKCYIPLLQAELEAAHSTTYTIYNHGYPGCDTYKLLYGGGYPIRPCPGIDVVLNRYNASHILIMAGTNDFKKGFPPSSSKSNLGAMIDRARKSGCEPVLATIIPSCQKLDFYLWTEDLSLNYIPPLSRKKNCLLADPFRAYLAYGPYKVWKNFLDKDCIHPVWEVGSQVIADAWFSALSAPLSTLPLIDSGDYDGDGTSDIALFRPGSGLWAIRKVTRLYFGQSGDIPTAGDFDGDGTTDLALFRPHSGLWAIRGVTRTYFGTEGDTPAPGDYGGEGSCQPAIYRKANSLWAIQETTRAYFGEAGDIPVPGYYQGQRAKQIALFRPSSGLWAIRDLTRFYFGTNGDQPVPAGFGGDGTDLAALFRPASGLWAIRGSSRYYFGANADQAQPAPYKGEAAISAVFRKSSGLWALRDFSRIYFGTKDDIPLSGRRPRPITPIPIPTSTPIPSPSPIPSSSPSPTPFPSPSHSPTPTT